MDLPTAQLLRVAAIDLIKPIAVQTTTLAALAHDSPLHALVAQRQLVIEAASAFVGTSKQVGSKHVDAVAKCGMAYLAHLKIFQLHGPTARDADAIVAQLQFMWHAKEDLQATLLTHEIFLTHLLLVAVYTHKYALLESAARTNPPFPHTEAAALLESTAQGLTAAASFFECYPAPHFNVTAANLRFRAGYYHGLALQCVALSATTDRIPMSMALVVQWTRVSIHVPPGEVGGDMALAMDMGASMWRGHIALAMANRMVKSVYAQSQLASQLPIRRFVRLLFLAAKESTHKYADYTAWFKQLGQQALALYTELRSHYREMYITTHDMDIGRVVAALPDHLWEYEEEGGGGGEEKDPSVDAAATVSEYALRKDLFDPFQPAAESAFGLTPNGFHTRLTTEMDRVLLAAGTAEPFRRRAIDDTTTVLSVGLGHHPQPMPANVLVHFMQDEQWAGLGPLSPREELLMAAVLLAERERCLTHMLATVHEPDARTRIVREQEAVRIQYESIRSLFLMDKVPIMN